MRKKIIAGNWKMNASLAEACNLTERIKRDLATCQNVDVVLCPPFTALKVVGDAIKHAAIDLGAQNMHWEKSGPYTGEISAEMLRDLYCHYVILGHSERRTYFHETDDTVNRKVRHALASQLKPMVCVGETLKEREAGQTESIIETQLRKSLANIALSSLADVLIAYEPVWAIGTGHTATPDQAQGVHAFIRNILAQMADEHIAQRMRIQYGGSMKPSNAKGLLSQPDIDGGLIGGASLEASTFVHIVKIAMDI